MGDNLPKIGTEAVVQGADRFFAILEQIEKATQKTADALSKQAEKTQKVAEQTAKSTEKMNPFSKILSKLDDQFGGIGKKIQGFANEMGISGDKVASFASSLGLSTTALVAVAAAAAIGIGAFIALGQRGAGLVGLAESFDRLNQSIGVDAVASLQRLREASAGTVSDFELIRLSNVALAGAVGEFGKQFGENLPKLLEIARVQARATGQDVGFLFQSLITGIKRGSPLLIDNTGLVLKISEANAQMAAQLGKTVEQLTAEEKQLAVLNATLAAGQTAINAFAGVQETAADKLARMNASITNILDTLAISVQPAFGMFLDVINRVIAVVGGLVTAVAPLIGSFLEMGAALITGPLNAILAIIEPIGKLISFFLTLATVILQPVMQAIGALGTAFGTGVTRIVQFIGEWVNANLGLNFENLALNIGRGAGFVFAAFYNGMMAVANAFIFPAVIEIATFIADFLVGESPPPRGPLSKIDKGGAAVMMSWLEGFAGVSLAPVSQVAADVNATLGSIGAMTMPQVEARIATLDAALQPFNDQLEIVKANFEAISQPAQVALDAIDRQMEKAEAALAAGDVGAAERVRLLDEQREKIQQAVDAQQQLVDAASIQQALAKSQQAPERALLAIQQARLKALETKPTKEAKDAAKAAGGGAAPTAQPVAGGAGAGAFDMGLPSVADLISGQQAVNQMGIDLGQGFQEGIIAGVDQGQQSLLASNQAALQTQVDRIGQANIGQRISDAFTGIGTSIQGALDGASIVINDWIGSITDPAREGSIPYSFNALANGDWSALTSSLTAPFQDLAAGVQLAVSDTVSYLTDPANEESIVASINSFATTLPEFMQPLVTGFADNFGLIRDGIVEFLDNTFNPENINSIPGTLMLLPTRVENALRDLGDSFNNSVLVPIQDTITNVGVAVGNFFVGTGEGTLKGMIDAGVAWFTELPQRIFDALASIGQVFFNAFVVPIIGGMNASIEGIEQLINAALSGLGTLLSGLQGIADAAGFGEQLATITAGLAGGINLPRIPLPTAPAATMPGARVGGFFSEGMLKTHANEGIMQNATKTAVFPANVMRDLEIISNFLSMGGGGFDLPMNMAGAGGGYGDTNFYNEFNVSNPPSTGNFTQTAAMLMSTRGRKRG